MNILHIAHLVIIVGSVFWHRITQFSNMKLPDRWMNYTKMGKCVSGTRFVPFKVPLKEGYSSELTSVTCFTPSQLLAIEPRIKLVIDLTYTKKYYDPKVFTNKQVQHKKILCPGGKTGLPPTDVIQTFCNAVDEFLVSHEKEDALIGVHCTHGLNRTGYLICKYMISRMNYAPKEAILLFESARGYPIERDVYIKDLMKGSSVLIPREKKRVRNGSYTSEDNWRVNSNCDTSEKSQQNRVKISNYKSHLNNVAERDHYTSRTEMNWRSNLFCSNSSSTDTNWRSPMNRNHCMDSAVERPSTSCKSDSYEKRKFSVDCHKQHHFDKVTNTTSEPFVRRSAFYEPDSKRHFDEKFSKNNSEQKSVNDARTNAHISRGYHEPSYDCSSDRSRLSRNYNYTNSFFKRNDHGCSNSRSYKNSKTPFSS